MASVNQFCWCGRVGKQIAKGKWLCKDHYVTDVITTLTRERDEARRECEELRHEVLELRKMANQWLPKRLQFSEKELTNAAN